MEIPHSASLLDGLELCTSHVRSISTKPLTRAAELCDAVPKGACFIKINTPGGVWRSRSATAACEWIAVVEELRGKEGNGEAQNWWSLLRYRSQLCNELLRKLLASRPAWPEERHNN